jgi:ABC-2 type transport system permease protein
MNPSSVVPTTHAALPNTGTSSPTSGRPSLLRMSISQARLDLVELLRDREATFFVLAFPVMLLVLFGSIFAGTIGATGVEASQVMASGIIASGIMSVSFVSLAISIAYERDLGVLLRLRATPMPPAAYFLGKTLFVLVTAIAETLVLLAVAAALYDLDLPSTPDRWAMFVAVFLLGTASGSALGVAVSSIPKSARNANAIVQAPFIFLQFISGVYLLFSDVPPVLQQVASLFPLKWMTQGLRSVFLPDTWQVMEPAGSWERPLVLVVLAAWTVGGLVLCRTTFRWTRRR